MEQAFVVGKMGFYIKANLKKIDQMGLVQRSILMAHSMKAIIKMEKKQDTEN